MGKGIEGSFRTKSTQAFVANRRVHRARVTQRPSEACADIIQHYKLDIKRRKLSRMYFAQYKREAEAHGGSRVPHRTRGFTGSPRHTIPSNQHPKHQWPGQMLKRET